MFTGKERTICAFEHKKADRLPVFDVVNKPDMYLDLLGQDNFDSKGRLVVQLAKKIGMDAVVVHSKPYTCLIPSRSEFDGPNTFTDRFGIKCQITDTSWPLGMAINPREADEALLQSGGDVTLLLTTENLQTGETERATLTVTLPAMK